LREYYIILPRIILKKAALLLINFSQKIVTLLHFNNDTQISNVYIFQTFIYYLEFLNEFSSLCAFFRVHDASKTRSSVIIKHRICYYYGE